MLIKIKTRIYAAPAVKGLGFIFDVCSQYEEDHSELSNLDYMDYWMNSIHAHTARNTRESVDNTTLSPRIFIVGTHRNSLHSDPQLQAKAVSWSTLAQL